MNRVLQGLAAIGFLTFSSLWCAVVAADTIEVRRVEIGSVHARGIFHSVNQGKKAPLVILLTGSGPNSPEETLPSFLTLDGKDQSLFDQIAQPLNEAGLHTLQVGKPGVDYSNGVWNGDKQSWYYDQKMYDNLRWGDLIRLASEAVQFGASQPEVDPTRVYFLGHSEGTQVAIDATLAGAPVKGLILLGYTGVSYKQTLDWQLFTRPVDFLFKTDIDGNADGMISANEWLPWQDLFPFLKFFEGEDAIPVSAVEARLRKDPSLSAEYDWFKNSDFLKGGIFDRAPLFDAVSKLSQDVTIFNGELDLQTPVKFAAPQIDACKIAGKENCNMIVVPGVGHGFSPPRPPRAHVFLDMTIGPIEKDVQSLLKKYALELL